MNALDHQAPARMLKIDVSTGAGNRLDSGVLPVILIPGVMGSRLEIFVRSRGRPVAWDPDSLLKMLRFALACGSGFARMIDASNAARVMDTGDYQGARARRGWNGVSKDAYGIFLEAIEALDLGPYHTPVHAIGYDWRQDNAQSGAFLAARVQEILQIYGTRRFVLITHSMGGLPARSMLQQHPQLAQKAQAVVHIAQPAAGAPIMYRRCFLGAPRKLDGLAMRLLLGHTPRRFLTATSGIQAPFQLLPTSQYRDRNFKPQGQAWLFSQQGDQYLPHLGDIWTHYLCRYSPPGIALPPPRDRRARALQPIVRRRIVKAQAFHRGLGQYCHPRTWSLVGLDEVVDCSFSFDPSRPTPQHPGGEVSMQKIQAQHRQADGDGTVPRRSACALMEEHTALVSSGELDYDRDRQIGIPHGEHQRICNQDDCIARVEELLRWCQRPLARVA